MIINTQPDITHSNHQADMKIILNQEQEALFHHLIKTGIYKELQRIELLSDRQLRMILNLHNKPPKVKLEHHY